MGAIPPLAGEDHVCPSCRLAYPDLTVEDARGIVAGVPTRARATFARVPEPRRRERPSAHVWSPVEYLCHLRDVYATSTIRLHRVRTEDEPVLEPMLNELRARRFRYNGLDPAAVLDELTANVAGLLDEVARMSPDGWQRSATRLPGEHRSARWLVRQAAHEGVHHLHDLAAYVPPEPGDPLP